MFPVFPLASPALSAAQESALRNSSLLYQVNRAAACPSAGATYDMTDGSFASGNTAQLANHLSAACGGATAPERVQLYRLTYAGRSQLQISVKATGFDPVLYVRKDDCTATEVLCKTGSDGVTLSTYIDHPPTGAYFIVVDGKGAAGGTFTLAVHETP